MNRLIFHLYLNLNYDYINSVNLVLTIIISPHLANNTDKIFVFLEKNLETWFDETLNRNIVAFSVNEYV